MERKTLLVALILAGSLVSFGALASEQQVSGSVRFGDKVVEFQHVIAYMRSDSVVVAFAPAAFDEAAIRKELKGGSRSPIDPVKERLMLRFDDDGQLEWVQFFLDGVSHNGSPGEVESQSDLSGGRVSGSAVMTEEDEVSGRPFRFEVSFDAAVVKP
jgi:hypothetical protein